MDCDALWVKIGGRSASRPNTALPTHDEATEAGGDRASPMDRPRACMLTLPRQGSAVLGGSGDARRGVLLA